MSRANNFCIASVLALAAPAASANCGLAFCMVNTNWNLQGLAAEPGVRLDMRYEFVRLDQPMNGSDKVAVGQIPRHHDEVRTINRNLVSSLDYTIDDQWSVSAVVPILDADHQHIHNHRGAQVPESWSFTRLGDVRVSGRYQLAAADTASGKINFYGASFGLKLPTGVRDVTNEAGDQAERSLQPGTGTTDVLLGAFFSQVLPESDASWFVQALGQSPVNSREDYRPGKRLTIDAGYRHELSERVGLMLQVNALWRGRDSGAQAEADDSGGRFFYASPGLSYSISKQTQIYTFVQLPLYQHVNGVQLTADWSALLGLTMRF